VQEKLRRNGALYDAQVKKILSAELYKRLISVGFFDRMEVSNSTEAVGYIASPNDFQKYERAQTRPQHKEQAIRAAYLAAALACIALDAALEHVLYEDSASRYKAIAAGVTYGDAGDAKVQKSIDTVLSVIAEGMEWACCGAASKGRAG
jgi:hypothetical protein